MLRLISRSKQVPFGFKFHQPQTGWRSRNFASFERIVEDLIRHRKANPAVTAKYKLATDYNTVAAEVDLYNAMRCEKMKWYDYITGISLRPAGGQASVIPFTERPNRSLGLQLKKVAVGASVIIEWIKSGGEAVQQSLANERASICTECPLNERGDWTRFFTVPISEGIRAEMQRRKQWKLETPFDSQLCVCAACSCPLPLKVHMPIDKILAKIPEESKEALAPGCWIRKEGNL